LPRNDFDVKHHAQTLQEAISNGKPYRIHQVKQLYEDFKEQTAELFELTPLDSVENCEKLLGSLPELRKIIQMKNNAVSNSDYEGAAAYHSQETSYIQAKLTSAGFDKGDYYFSNQRIIFYMK